MHQEYIKPDPWSIIEEGFDPEMVKSSESLFSIGNGAMGQRANFEETYSGPTFQGSYVAGVYYPDKTRVGWWKNGYPEYFAKVLNAPNWIGIDIQLEGEQLDLHHCEKVTDFRRELNMKEGWYKRSFTATLRNGLEIAFESTRVLSLEWDELGLIDLKVTPINRAAEVKFIPYLDGGITNEDSNWDDKFWEIHGISHDGDRAFIHSMTNKTEFHVCTYMGNRISLDGQLQNIRPEADQLPLSVRMGYTVQAGQGQSAGIEKYAGYTVSTNHEVDQLIGAANKAIDHGMNAGVNGVIQTQADQWKAIWDMADIVIEGDVKAQQGIRFNIFQLNQTYLGRDSRLNIGPKGFTGEKYGGSTYWDTEAYCIPFYMATKNQEVARNLLTYRYNHLDRAIENAGKLGFTDGAALYPMVTMNGEECHNEWEITFEEIHRNGAIAFAIYNYTRFTNDHSYIPEKGLEVLIGIARFWAQRATYSTQKEQYVILGVTGPNEYENNVNNNWYTNFTARWCMTYAAEQVNAVQENYPEDYKRILAKTGLKEEELHNWTKISEGMYFPHSEKHGVYLQQDGFLDKELITVDELGKHNRPINQKWSWDRILRSPYIKQADVLQGFYFFEDQFSQEELQAHFDFYEPFTVHESSLSPCVHSIQAAKLGRMEQAYTFYLRTSRLDLDDYNKEVEEGCHITSMAGTWMSIVEGFAGMRVREDKLSFEPQIPQQWEAYTFKINFRGRILTVRIDHQGSTYSVDSGEPMNVLERGEIVEVTASAS